MSMSTILVTTDLSPESERAFAPAAALARGLGLPIALLHVIVDTKAKGGNGAGLQPSDRAVAHEVETATRRLQQMRGDLPGDVTVEPRAIVGRELVAAIHDFAASVGARFIVLSTHGRTGLGHLVLGSVAEAVVRHSALPVVCCPERDAD